MIDHETKQILIQKTWCHGQAIAPVYGFVCLWWYSSNHFQPMELLFPSLFLPYWCFLSYRSIFVEFSYKKILMGGILAEISHVIVFLVAIQKKRDASSNKEGTTTTTMNLLMIIASALFFVETLAFLLVVTAFRPRSGRGENNNNNNGGGGREPLHSYHNDQLSSIL